MVREVVAVHVAEVHVAEVHEVAAHVAEVPAVGAREVAALAVEVRVAEVVRVVAVVAAVEVQSKRRHGLRREFDFVAAKHEVVLVCQNQRPARTPYPGKSPF